MAKQITIFTTNTCSYCVMVKRYLNAKNLQFDEVNLDENPERRTEAIEVSRGALTVPVTVVTKQDDSQEVIVGYNLARLAPAIA